MAEINEPKTIFETARDEERIELIRAYLRQNMGPITYQDLVSDVAMLMKEYDRAREFTRTEILSSPELKALIEIIERAMTDWLDEQPIAEALSNFQAKFGSPTEGEK